MNFDLQNVQYDINYALNNINQLNLDPNQQMKVYQKQQQILSGTNLIPQVLNADNILIDQRIGVQKQTTYDQIPDYQYQLQPPGYNSGDQTQKAPAFLRSNSLPDMDENGSSKKKSYPKVQGEDYEEDILDLAGRREEIEEEIKNEETDERNGLSIEEMRNSQFQGQSTIKSNYSSHHYPRSGSQVISEQPYNTRIENLANQHSPENLHEEDEHVHPQVDPNLDKS